MKTLALPLLLALPSLAASQPAASPAAVSTSALVSGTSQPLTPTPGSVDSSKIRLAASDAAGALADAEAALAHGGGADADAKRALGLTFAEVLADYAEAAKLDPRYIERYKGLIAQQESEEHPAKNAGGKGLGGVPIAGVLGAVAIGGLCIGIGAVMLNARKDAETAPDDEDVKPGGIEKQAGEKPKPADLEPPPKKEPPKA